KGNHGFAGDACCGDHAPVGTLVGGLHRLLGHHVGGAEGATQRGDGLEVAAHNYVFSDRHATFEAAGAVGGAAETFRGLLVRDFVLHFAAVGAGSHNSRANFDAFDGL